MDKLIIKPEKIRSKQAEYMRRYRAKHPGETKRRIDKLIQDERSATLKEVGKWLEENGCRIVYVTLTKSWCEHPSAKNSLLRGELPEEK